MLALQVLHSPLLWSCRCLSYLLLQAVVKANSELELHLIALHMLAGLSEANMALWASLYWPSSLTRVASVESVASLPLLELSAVPFS